MNDEQWKIFCYKDESTNYKISSYGRVYNTKTNKFVKGTRNRNEYHSTQLSLNGKPVTFPTHRLVALTFLPNPNNHTVVDHIDRDKFNNHVENLRWVSVKENANNKERKKKNAKTCYYDGDLSTFEEVAGLNGKFLVNKNGLFIKSNTYRVIKGGERNGYRRLLCDGKWHSMHRLVWETFNGPIENNMVIDHINGIRDDNRLENLRLVSQSENVENGYNNGHSSQKKIYQYSLNGDFLAAFDRLYQATEVTKTSAPAISSAAKRGGTCGGFLWSFKELTDEEISDLVAKINQPDPRGLGISQYDKSGNFVKHYGSVGKAAKELGCSKSTICRGIEGNRLAKGYYWILDSKKDEITIEKLLEK